MWRRVAKEESVLVEGGFGLQVRRLDGREENKIFIVDRPGAMVAKCNEWPERTAADLCAVLRAT